MGLVRSSNPLHLLQATVVGIIAQQRPQGLENLNSPISTLQAHPYPNSMERTMSEKLQTGSRFPSMTLKTVDGGTLKIPDDITSRYAAVLFYRGHW